MQRRALEVQLAAPEEWEPIDVAVDLRAITAPTLVVAGSVTFLAFRLLCALFRRVGGNVRRSRYSV